MTEEELRRDQDRGMRAKALLNDKILYEAFATVDAKCVELWRDAKTPEDREGFWLRLQSLQHVKAAIEGVIQKGDIAERKLKQLIEGKKPLF